MSRGKKSVRVTLEFKSPALCFDDAHGDYGPSALDNVECLLRGMSFSILERRTLAMMAHNRVYAAIPKHHTKKRRDSEAMHKRRMEIYDDNLDIVQETLKEARYEVVTNWNRDE